MGILDGFYNSDTGTLTPQGAGILGMIQALGNSPGIAPQAASRLPLARPNLLNILGNEAGGYLQGTQSAAKQQAETNYIKAQGGKDNLGTLSLLNRYNLTAPIFGASPLSMNDLLAGKFDSKTMQAVQGAQTQATPGMAAPGMMAGQQQPQQQPNLLQHIFSGILGGGQQPSPAAPPAPAMAPQPAMTSPAPSPAMAMPSAPMQASPPMQPSNPAAASAPQGGLLGGQGPGGVNMDLVRRNIINQDVYGVGLTPVQKNIIAMGGDPGDPQYKQLLQNEAIKASGINPSIGGERPGVPFQTYDPATNSMKIAPGALQNLTSGAAATEAGKYQYELGKIAAQGGQSRQTAAFEQGLKNQNTLVDWYDPNAKTTRKITQTDALRMSQGGAPPPVVPGAAGASPGADMGLQKDNSYITPEGTKIPPPPAPLKKANGFQSEAGAADKATQATYAETIKGWEDSVQPAQQTEQRFQAMWEAEKALGGPTGAWAEAKVEIGRHLIAAGVDPGTVKDLLHADPAQAQIILKNNFGTALSTLSAAKLGRITQNEIFALQKNLTNVSLEPGANAAITAQGIGIARQQQALARDWSIAQQMGYADPYSYERNWAKANPLQSFVTQATKELGPIPTGNAAALKAYDWDPVKGLQPRKPVKGLQPR